MCSVTSSVDGELWRPTTCSTWTSMSDIFCTFSFESSVISSQENLIGITLSKYDWLISVGRICVCQLLFSLVLLVITKRMQPAWTSKDYQPF
jgi:hypothetical protein